MSACMVITYNKGKDQPGKVANPARGQLNREIDFSLSPCVAYVRMRLSTEKTKCFGRAWELLAHNFEFFDEVRNC